MKTITEIKQMENKSVIDSFEGFVTRIFEPDAPTPAQADKGIHTQRIEVAGGAGESGQLIYVKLLRRTLHLEKDFEGKQFHFDSTRDDHDRLTGLHVSRYVDKDKVEHVGIDAWGGASMYCLEVKEAADKQQMERADDDERPCNIPATQIPSGSFLDGVRNYAALHRSIYDVFKAAYGDEITNEAIADKSTHYLIGCHDSKIEGLVKDLVAARKTLTSQAPAMVDLQKMKDEPLVRQAQKEFDAKPVESTQVKGDWRKVTNSKGKLICEMDKSDIIDLAITMLPFHGSDKPKIKEVFTAVLLRRRELELPYDEIYDAFECALPDEYTLEAVQGSYKVLFNQFKQDNDRTCLEILKDQKTFIEMIENYSK